MSLPDVLVGISRFGPAETQLGFYQLDKGHFYSSIYIYIYLQVVARYARARARVCVCVDVVNYYLAICMCDVQSVDVNALCIRARCVC